MKIIVTGSLGNISRPLTKELIGKGHQVTVVSSNAGRTQEIEGLGAKAAIGLLEDLEFLKQTFSGADAVYTMVPPANYFDHSLHLPSYYTRLGSNYAKAIEQSSVGRVVNLSSIGAHMDQGNGILLGTHLVENLLNDLPSEVVISHIRPTEFYYNLLPQVHRIKNSGFMASNIDGEVVNAWVSPLDIATVVGEEITSVTMERKVRYVASEEITYDELVRILGKAIGQPSLGWVTLMDEQMIEGLVAIGMNPTIAEEMTEMYAAINSGLLYEHYRLNRPSTMGQVKVRDFAEDFAAAYNRL
ncbi:NAD(P)H-binding protein [Muricauda oceani]|uniref:NAD(P)H-binding protein n=1 Tax=Flagellimonas oceani TaxID=2698672 RepID=A0A6G7IYT9_9FLAO|nr:NAD(P)H-binding protein [Allomuricauda oceani]MBW8244898.1 NAD(P)H-binding protein [Allomuricauda oceani]QII43559.1 NAD(P)H-binding protein [Allomuricauda oceani]